jgi:hypothetical protein
MKKIPMIVAVSALATTGVAALAVTSVSAGCGATVEVHNRRSSNITVDWEDSDSRSGVNTPWGIAAGSWKKLIENASNTIEPGDIESRAILLDFGCNTLHEYRLEVTKSNGTSFVYSGWETDSVAHIDVW